MRMVVASILIVMGLALRLAAIKTLRDCFSMELRVPPQIVTNGVYRWIRHPSYVGTLAMILGMSLWSPIVSCCYIGFIFLFSRATHEEQILSMHPDYAEYRKKTGGFLPKLWR